MRTRQFAALFACIPLLMSAGCAQESAGTAGSTSSVTPSSAATATSSLPVSLAVYAGLRLMAVRMATVNGDAHPTRMEAVAVDDVNHADEVLSGATTNTPGSAGYVLEVQGRSCATSALSLPAPARRRGRSQTPSYGPAALPTRVTASVRSGPTYTAWARLSACRTRRPQRRWPLFRTPW